MDMLLHMISVLVPFVCFLCAMHLCMINLCAMNLNAMHLCEMNLCEKNPCVHISQVNANHDSVSQ